MKTTKLTSFSFSLITTIKKISFRSHISRIMHSNNSKVGNHIREEIKEMLFTQEHRVEMNMVEGQDGLFL